MSEVEIHYDDRMHKLDGTTGPFQMSDSPEGLQWQSTGGDETDLVAGTKVIITINSDIVTSGKEFAELVIHALGHPYLGVGSDDEAWLLTREGTIYDEIFSTPDERETSPQDYYEGTTIVGSRHGDNITGSAWNDTVSGLSGNDVLNGGGGNDLVMGGAGMDWLSGGQGNNMVAGGLDADTYVPVVDAGMDYVIELGGVDRIDLSAHDMGSCHFYRSGDTLNIALPSGALIVIENQWIAGSKVEQFVFAHGTVASSYIEYLADNNAGSGSGLCYDEYGRQIMCSPYGLPIVFDLDGDESSWCRSTVHMRASTWTLTERRIGLVGLPPTMAFLHSTGMGTAASTILMKSLSCVTFLEPRATLKGFMPMTRIETVF